jgi:ubiquinone/menaquinone biosynthesis C-methylase UbiE
MDEDLTQSWIHALDYTKSTYNRKMPDFSNFLQVQTSTAWGRNLAEFAAFCSPGSGAKTLDVGCGPGLLPAIFAEWGCLSTGIDLDFRLLREPLAPRLAQADALRLPFPEAGFNLVTATNVLFMLADPVTALEEWARVVKAEGAICLLNPSELLSMEAASRIVKQRDLQGTASESLLAWARNAEAYSRWTEAQTRALLGAAGLRMDVSALKIGPGFARFSRAGKIPANY